MAEAPPLPFSTSDLFLPLFFSLSLSAGHSLTQFVRHCADHFLNSEHKEIRMEAARTCSRLLTPSIHLISGHGHVVSQTAVQVVADVLSKLLVVGITDPGGAPGRGDGDGWMGRWVNWWVWVCGAQTSRWLA